MDRKICMNFYVERESALRFSPAFRAARAVIMAVPLIYFSYIAWAYYAAGAEYAELNARIESEQEQLDKYQRELKNSRVLFFDFDSSETVVKKGFFFDFEGPFADTVEAVFSPEMNSRTAKLKESLAGAVRIVRSWERSILEGISRCVAGVGAKVAVSSLRVDFNSLRADFNVKCQSNEELRRLAGAIRGQAWAARVFVSTLKAGPDEVSAYVAISLKEADQFE